MFHQAFKEPSTSSSFTSHISRNSKRIFPTKFEQLNNDSLTSLGSNSFNLSAIFDQKTNHGASFTDAAGGAGTGNYENPDDTGPSIANAKSKYNTAIARAAVGLSISGTADNDNLVGTVNDDTLNGLGGNDTLNGGLGGDTLNGGTGIDEASYANATSGVWVFMIPGGTDPNRGEALGDVYTDIENIRGTAFGDLLWGNAGENRLFGGAGEDTMYGWDGAGTNYLFGEDGADTLVCGGAIDIVDGGVGVDVLRFNGDVVSYQLSNAGVTVSLVNQAINTGDAAGDIYISVEDVTGTRFNDVIYGDDGSLNNLDGLSGNDTIFGNGGQDIMIGGAGADLLNGGDGDDIADYETYLFSESNTIAVEGVTASLIDPTMNTKDAAGDTYVSIENMAGSLHNDTLYGNNSNNVFLAWAGNDRVFGLGGDDALEGMPGEDTLDGGDGIDTASYDSAGKLVIASWGFYTQVGIGVTASLLNPLINTNDARGDVYIRIENLLGSSFADRLQGDNNANTIFGNAGNDTLQGENGDDLLEGGLGADRHEGGIGFDFASYSRATTGINVSLDGSITATAEAVGDTFQDVENILGSNFNDLLSGDGSANFLRGEAGVDQLFGRNGDDFLIGGAGADVLNGGAGQDIASYETATAAVVASLQAPASNTGDATGDTYVDVEGLYGSNFGDTLTGFAASATLLSGLGGNDNLTAGSANDVLIGGAGGDVLNGGAGSDMASYITATAGVSANLGGPASNTGEAAGDTYNGIENLAGSQFDDTLRGDNNVNSLLGVNGNDSLYGEGGDDVLTGGLGNDFLDGGAGIDTVAYDGATTGVNVYLSLPNLNSGAEAAGDSYANVENIIGSNFADKLQGSGTANTIFGGTGNDTLEGENGDDQLEGGAGADVHNGGAGFDFATYSASTSGVNAAMDGSIAGFGDGVGDTFTGIEGLIGSRFNDVLFGDGNANFIKGEDGSDSLWAQGGDDFLFGGNGADTMDGGTGFDVASYETAKTAVRASLQDTSINSGEAAGDVYGNIEALYGSNFGDALTGFTFATNFLRGLEGNDTLTGGITNDILIGDAGADQLNGGSGTDIASYLLATSGVSAFLTGAGTNAGEAAGDTYSGIENLVGSNFNDQLGGDLTANSLLGQAGNDSLYGDGGDDVLTGGLGADFLDGQIGIDTVAYDASTAAVSISLAGTSASTGGEAQGDTFANVENIIGSSFNDVLGGNSVANTIFGGAGNDTLIGGGGEDLLEGGVGSDALNGEGGYTYASYTRAASGVTVFIAGPQLNSGDAQGDSYVSIEGVLGSQFADILGGDGANNVLQGFDGNDWLFGSDGLDYLVGGEGNDILSGGFGNDRLEGGAGIDVLYFRDHAGGVTANMFDTTSNTGEAQGDIYFDIENVWGSRFNDNLTGDNGSGQVYGFEGNDTLSGLGGDDYFYGGDGADLITGGAGADNFFFLSWNDHTNQYGTLEPYEGGDTFTDFQSGTDKIILSRYWFGFGNIDGPAAALTETHSNFVTNGNVATGRPSLIWNNSARTLSFDADGNGATQAVLLGTFQGSGQLTLGDIWTA